RVPGWATPAKTLGYAPENPGSLAKLQPRMRGHDRVGTLREPSAMDFSGKSVTAPALALPYGSKMQESLSTPVQQRQDGRIARRHSWFFPFVVLAGGEQRPHLARLQCSAARETRATHRLQVRCALKIFGIDITQSPALFQN